jgi:S1-C subfamily serine protease
MLHQQIRRVALDVQAIPQTFQRMRQSPQHDQAASGMAGSAWLGILSLTVTPEVAQVIGLPSDLQGILVEQMEQQGPADQAHLQAGNKSVVINGHRRWVGGDIIVAADGQRVRRLQDVQTFLRRARPGQIVTLTLLRNREWMRVMVTLGKRPASTLPTP